ncbi:hypothetical protein FHU10_2441 [Serratia fonticola]|uniref:Uncharacterized protein n=1 Tax=Serratia fonticola TaxID=47917 RepID=A0A559T5L9_SERFO|nr:hypothetical protein FHU11_0782 [Serratia fonticola]TVZ69898.1 hypothetical protein FHU10_2441 [Serratia fonticola]
MGQKQKIPLTPALCQCNAREHAEHPCGEKERTGIVDEPVPLRQVGVVNPIAERMSNISELDRFPLPAGCTVRGHHEHLFGDMVDTYN